MNALFALTVLKDIFTLQVTKPNSNLRNTYALSRAWRIKEAIVFLCPLGLTIKLNQFN